MPRSHPRDKWAYLPDTAPKDRSGNGAGPVLPFSPPIDSLRPRPWWDCLIVRRSDFQCHDLWKGRENFGKCWSCGAATACSTVSISSDPMTDRYGRNEVFIHDAEVLRHNCLDKTRWKWARSKRAPGALWVGDGGRGL